MTYLPRFCLEDSDPVLNEKIEPKLTDKKLTFSTSNPELEL